MNWCISKLGNFGGVSTKGITINRENYSIPLQLAKDNQKFQYKVISRRGTLSIFGEAILWLKNSGIINQVYKAEAKLPIEMYKDLASFKLYRSDVGLFVNKAKYPLYQIDLSSQPTMISMLSL